MMNRHRLALGISGGIAACKAPALIRELSRRGVDVKAVITSSAKNFITEVTLRSLTGNPVYDRMFVSQTEPFEHISLADWAEVLLVAPATANTIGKFANGIADDLLSTLYVSFNRPVAIAPAMNEAMLLHPAVQRNLKTLMGDGVHVIEPERGSLACGAEGLGRMREPEQIADEIMPFFTLIGKLKGRKVLVSASATREFIDPVRFLSNPSSGKMGFALAAAFAMNGAEVTLITGPTSQVAGAAIRTVKVTSAREMFDAVTATAPEMDIIVMSAAVADYRPAFTAKEKIKKAKTDLKSIPLERNPDILAHLGKNKRPGTVLVGFAAETNEHLENAVDKLKRKNLDAIVLNDVAAKTSGFAVDNNAAVLVTPHKRAAGKPAKTVSGMKISHCEFPLMSKRALAARLVEAIAGLVGQ